MKIYKKFLYSSLMFLVILASYWLNEKVIAMPPAPSREGGCSNTAMQKIITEKSRASIDNCINWYNTIFLIWDAVYQQHSPWTIYDYWWTINVHLIPDTIEYNDLISGIEWPHYLGLPIEKFKNNDFDFEKYKIWSIPHKNFYTKIWNRSASRYEEQCAEINENTKIINYHYIIEKTWNNYNLNLTSIEESWWPQIPILYYINIDGYPVIKNIPRIITLFISVFLFLLLWTKLQKKDDNIKNKKIRLYSWLVLFIVLNFINISLVDIILTKFNSNWFICLFLELFFSLIKNTLIFKYILSIRWKYSVLLSIFFSIIEISSLLYLFHILQIIEL